MGRGCKGYRGANIEHRTSNIESNTFKLWRSRFNTWVTQMVQNIGNTRAAELDKLADALETNRTYEPEERVCIESDAQR